MKLLRKWINHFIFMEDYDLINHPSKPDMNAWALQMAFGSLFGVVTAGTFITGYLVYLGASDELVSYIGILPSILGIFLVFLSLLVQQYKKPKGVVLVANGLAKALMLSIIAVPFFARGTAAVVLVFLLYSLGNIFNSVNNLMINNWFIKSIDTDIRGRFFSVRQIISMILNSFLPILAGMLVDQFSDKYHAFLILYILGTVFALFEVFSFSKIRNCQMEIIETKLNLLDVIRIPVKNKPFMQYVIYNSFFYFFLYLSASMRQLYMIKYLEMSYTFINGMNMLYFALQAIFLYKMWGRVNDRLSSNFVMIVSMWLYGLDLFSWVFVSHSTAFIILPLAYIVAAFNGPAYTIGSYNYRYTTIPEKGRTLYDAFYTSCIGLVLIVAPYVGNLLKNLLAAAGAGNLLNFGEFRLMYLLSALTLFAMQAVRYLMMKKENPDDLIFQKSSYIEAMKCLLR